MDATDQNTMLAEAFATLADEIVDSYLEYYPHLAVRLGLHEYDGRITDFSRDALDARVREIQTQLSHLADISPATLPEDLAHDYSLLQSGLEGELWRWQDFRGHARNPLSSSRSCSNSRHVVGVACIVVTCSATHKAASLAPSRVLS